MRKEPAYAFERNTPIHETRETKGVVNWLRPKPWLRHAARKAEMQTVEVLQPLLGSLEHPTVVVIGVGHGDIFEFLWREPGTTRIGIDVNHDVIVKALAGRAGYYLPVEADALHLPLPDNSVDVVVYDFALHHFVGQGPLETFIAEGSRVLRPGGFMIAREPSSYSPSGLALNLLNRFGVMHSLTGASNQEFALSPPRLIQMLERHGSVLAVEGLVYLFAHRLPPRVQDLIAKSEAYLFRGPRARWFADFVLYVVRRDGV